MSVDRAQFSVNQLLDLNVLGGVKVAPGGGKVAYSISENGTPKGERSPESRVWIHDVSEGRATQVTYGPYTDRQPGWSPDGTRLTFLSDREKRGTAQLYLLESSLRDARKLTELPAGVRSHQWSPCCRFIALTASDHVPEQDNDVRLFDADQRFVRLYRCDIASGETVPVNHGDLQIWEYCWSPDSTKVAAIVSDEPFEWGWYGARLVTIEIDTGTVETVHAPERQIARPAWSPDGTQIAFITCLWSDPGMTGGDIVVVDLASGDVRNLTEGERRSHFTVHWRADSSGLVSIGLERARAQICRVDRNDGSTPLWTDNAALSDYGGEFDSQSGRVAIALSRPDLPPEVWLSDGDVQSDPVQMHQVTSSNVSIDLPPFEMRRLSWGAPDGLEIEGIYYSPTGGDNRSAPPMMTLVHGGPTSAASPSFPLAGSLAWIPLLIEHGVAVFVPNFRGSNGYGVEFAELNLGDLGGMDLQDILSGIDECVRRGLADETRLAIGGWSYGGYITAWAITQTNRFAAAVAGASITNWYSFHGGTNIPGFDGQFIGTSSNELDSPYAWTSPLFFCKHVRTPTLFVHGERDDCCPVGQAYEMTRALRRHGTTVECAVYPREGHGFIEREHRRDMVERSVGWVRTHLGLL